MKTLSNFLGAAFLAACLSACSGSTSTSSNTTSSAPVVTLAQAQAVAKNLYGTIQADVATYESANPSLPAATKGPLDESVANAVLTVATSVVNGLPANVLSANDKIIADAAISILQNLLVFLPAPAAAPAS